MLGLGVGATVAVNSIYGVRGGTLGILLSAWPAIAFIGAAELTIWMVRAATSVRAGTRYSKANEIRKFARMNGYDVAERGRIPAEITEAYERAQGNGHKEDVTISATEWIDPRERHSETENNLP
jgi:hypothetical protein